MPPRTRGSLLALVVVMLASLFGTSIAPGLASAHDYSRPVLAWYYGWWRSYNWTNTSDLPPTQYDSDNDDVMRRQIREARDAGINAFICTWHYNCPRLLQIAEQEGNFSVAYAIDPAAEGKLGSFDAIVTAMKGMSSDMASRAYARWNGKPLIVFWNGANLLPGDSSVSAYQQLRQAVDPGFSQFWLGGGDDFAYLDAFDAIHYFDISWESSPGAAMASYSTRLSSYNAGHGTDNPFVATVMPGYDDIAYRNGHYRDRESGAYYHATWDSVFDYEADAVVITSWNEWYEGSQIEPSVSYGNLYLDITRERATEYRNTLGIFADPEMLDVWNRTDRAVRDGVTSRSWVWGHARTAGAHELYNGGTRLVQYFDKSRMEVNNPSGDRNHPWFVTNGLLVREMIDGRLQTGDNTFESRGPSDEVLAGDPRPVNLGVPGYDDLGAHLGATADRTGQSISKQLVRGGAVQGIAPPEDVRLHAYIAETGHNIAGPFWDYMHLQGPIWNGSGYVNGAIIDWVFAFGYPITEPYWVRASVAGTEQWVLVQAFERRVLTYTPANNPGFQVEMGNVGQHYHHWRYGWSW